jgi:hypothetical protein
VGGLAFYRYISEAAAKKSASEWLQVANLINQSFECLLYMKSRYNTRTFVPSTNLHTTNTISKQHSRQSKYHTKNAPMLKTPTPSSLQHQYILMYKTHCALLFFFPVVSSYSFRIIDPRSSYSPVDAVAEAGASGFAPS